ncbi:MAG: terminase family protein [Candidatus Omnitrophota bacterium]
MLTNDCQAPAKKPNFLAAQLKVLESIIQNIAEKLMSADDILDGKIQSLHKLYQSHLRLYFSIKKCIKKNASAKKDKLNSPAEDRKIPLPPPWKDDISVFAKEALGMELLEHQKQLCLSQKRMNLLIAGRGAGKSAAARVKALHNALIQEHHIVLAVSSGQRMSSDFGARLLDLIRESPLFEYVQSISNEQVTFQNGSVIKLLPANPDTIRGYHPKTFGQCNGMTVILDEACFMEQGDEIRKAVEYALITTPRETGRIYIVSSPSTIGSWVYEYIQKANDPGAGIAVFQCPSSANPSITPQEIERLRRTKNDLEFRAEVLGEWVDGAYGLFSGLIDPNCVEASALPDDAVCVLGADLALSYSCAHDRNALAVAAKWRVENGGAGEDHYRLIDLSILQQASDAEIRQEAARLIEKYGVAAAVIEQFQGRALAEHCQALGVETMLVAPTSSLQQTAFHEMHRLLKQGLLELSNDLPPEFFGELQAFEYRRESNGRISFGHPASGKAHDDCVYAAAWAVYGALETPPLETAPPLKPMIDFIEKR